MTDLIRTDKQLARDINLEHGQVETHKHNTIQHAIRCGELLQEAKDRQGHGDWLAWLAKNFEATPRIAQMYMRVAANAKRASHLEDADSLRAALRLLASPDAPEKPSEPKDEQTRRMLASANVPLDAEPIIDAEVVEEPRPGLGTTEQRTWLRIPNRLTAIKQAFGEAAGDQLSDDSAAEALFEASREARQAAIDLEQLASALKRQAA